MSANQTRKWYDFIIRMRAEGKCETDTENACLSVGSSAVIDSSLERILLEAAKFLYKRYIKSTR